MSFIHIWLKISKTCLRQVNLFVKLAPFQIVKLLFDTILHRGNWVITRVTIWRHTKLAFLRAILGTKALKNCLVLLRNNQNVQDEHNLYFWLKNIHEFQNGSIPFSLFHLLLVKTSKNSKNMSFVVQFWNQWIFLSQNYRLCSSCTFWLTLKRTKQFFGAFVSKMALKNASFVWKMGFGRFVFSTTVILL